VSFPTIVGEAKGLAVHGVGDDALDDDTEGRGHRHGAHVRGDGGGGRLSVLRAATRRRWGGVAIMQPRAPFVAGGRGWMR